MLQRIKNTQNKQIKVFNKLEEVMYQQQFSVSKRILGNQTSTTFLKLDEISESESQSNTR